MEVLINGVGYTRRAVHYSVSIGTFVYWVNTVRAKVQNKQVGINVVIMICCFVLVTLDLDSSFLFCNI